MMETFYKVAFDLSCYYTIVAFFMKYGLQYDTNPLTFAVLLAAALGVVLCERLPKGVMPAKLVCLLFPLLALIWEDSRLGQLQFILPWVYFVTISISERYKLYYDSFLSLFRTLLILIVTVDVLLCFYNGGQGFSSIGCAVPYFIVFLGAGVLLLQSLRYASSRGDKKRFEKFQYRQTAAFFGSCILLTVGRVVELFAWLYHAFVQPVFEFAFLYLVQLFRALFTTENPSVNKNVIDQAYLKFYENNAAKQLPDLKNKLSKIVDASEKNYKQTDYTVAIVIVGILVVIFVFILLMGGKQKKHAAEEVLDERESVEAEDEPEVKLKKRSGNPLLVIRYYYRAFIRKTETSKRPVFASDTTKDIREKYLKRRSEAKEVTGELTEIYRRARYSGQSMTKEDAAKMRSLVEQCKEK